MMEKGSVRFCIFCGKENDPAGSFCAACGKPLYPTEDLLADYLKKEAKEQLVSKAEDTIFEKLKAFLLAHWYGIAMTVSIVFTAAAAISALAAPSVPRDAVRIDEPPAVSILGYLATGGENGPAVPAGKPLADAQTAEETPAPADDEIYYRYLRDVILPEYGWAKTGTMDWTVPDLNNASGGTLADLMAEYRDAETGEGGHGVLSALVRDLDGDGVDDMLVLFLDREAGGRTDIKNVYDDGNATVLCARLYTMARSGASDWTVAAADEVRAVAELGGLCCGSMTAGLITWEGTPYLYTYEWMEDITTYGPVLTRIYHFENGRFILDSASGWIGWGQATYVDDVNAYCGAAGVSFLETGVAEAVNLVTKANSRLPMDEDPNLSRLKGSLLTRLVFSWTPGTKQSGITSDVTDCTYIRMALDQDPAEAMKLRGEEPDLTPKVNEHKAVAHALAADVSAASGIALELRSESTYEENYTASYSSAAGAALSITISPDGKITNVRVTADYADRAKEWPKLKDAVLSDPTLDLPADIRTRFAGDCGYSLESYFEGGRVVTGAVSSVIFNVSFS